MNRPIALACCLMVASATSSALGGEPQRISFDCSAAAEERTIPEDGLSVTATTGPAWLDLAELGHMLVVTPPASATHRTIQTPFRHVRHLVALQAGQSATVSRRLPMPGRTVKASMRLACDDSGDDPWIIGMADIFPVEYRAISADELSAIKTRLEPMLALSRGDEQRMIVRHALAGAENMGGNTAIATEQYAEVEAGWLSLGDRRLARVARVARVENLMRVSRHEEALALASDPEMQGIGSDYLAARLFLGRCLALRYLGRMTESLACFHRGIPAMERLGETTDVVSALQDAADVARFAGLDDESRQLAERALSMSGGDAPGMDMIRGRIQFTLAEMAFRRGDITGALAGLNTALTEFSPNAPRWEANVLLRIAALYRTLGATDEAVDFVDAALRRLSERDAPARVAVAKVVMAQIDMTAGRTDRADSNLRSAADTYARLKMPLELNSTNATRMRLALQVGDLPTAAALLAGHDRTQKSHADIWRVQQAHLLSLQGDCDKALAMNATLDRRQLPLDLALRRMQIQAQCLATSGRGDDAERQLLDRARSIVALAQRVESPLLRQMLVGYIAPLRETALQLHAEANNGNLGDPARLWQWLQLDQAALAGSHAEGSTASSRDFDAEVSRELTAARQTGMTSSEMSSRHLLAILTPSPRKQSAVPPPIVAEVSLTELQQRLGEALLVSYVAAGPHSALLWVGGDEARVQRTSELVDLRSSNDRLVAALSQRTTSAAAIDREAGRVAALLWRDAPGRHAPAALLVDASSPLASLPWSALTWPGADAPLLETTSISLVRIGAQANRVTGAANQPISVFIAGQDNSTGMETLWNARDEPALISGALGSSRPVPVNALHAADRDSLLDAFKDDGHVLHVAAHGGTLPSKIGYAGIWLEASADDKAPRFLSWMEILARGSRNPLVVLNACQLAESGISSTLGLSFADAVSRAGARQVVAARWPVSDGATALWVPAFYEGIAADNGAADALHDAQRRLRSSRMFRHPYYWASYTHFRWL